MLRIEGLIDRAKAGDEAAFGELVRTHQPEVFRLALKLLENYELALDASQETFLRAWRALPRFRGEAAISTWLHRITVNTSFSVRRRALRHAATPFDEAAHDFQSSDDLAEDTTDRLVLADRLRRALNQLPPVQRQLVMMKDVQGYSHAQLAAAQNITISASKVRLHRARRALRDLLALD